MSINANQAGDGFEFKAKVFSMTDYYIEVVEGAGGSEEIDELDVKRIKIEGKILSLKQPKGGSGFFSEISLKDKQKLAYEEIKLKAVLQQLGELKASQIELEKT